MTADDRIMRLRDKANKLPLLPGVYIMHAKNGEIIYVGKAKRLKMRVSQSSEATAGIMTRSERWCRRLKILNI